MSNLGSIAGTVAYGGTRLSGQNVHVYERTSGATLQSLTTTVNGNFLFSLLNTAKVYTVVAVPTVTTRPVLVQDRIVPDDTIENTRVLMHMDGTNNSTSVPQIGYSNLPAVCMGGVKLATAQAKFGSASCAFDGTAGSALRINDNVSPGNLLRLTYHFTIEFWIYPTVLPSGTVTLFYYGRGYNFDWPSMQCRMTNGNICFMSSFNNTGIDVGGDAGAYYFGVPTLNAWNHVAITRFDNTWRGFLNGIQGWGQTVGGVPRQVTFNDYLNIGSVDSTPGGLIERYTGYLDEFVWMAGVCRYTANFTPPTSSTNTMP